MQRSLMILVCAGALILSATALAQKVPLGPEIQVGVGGSIIFGSVAPAADPAGNFVVVWNTYGYDGDGSGVFGQRFNAAGTKLGDAFQVNTYTTYNQGDYGGGTAVAADGAGNFVVVWTSRDYYHYYPVWDPNRILAQRYDSAGAKRGGEFQVNALAPCSYPVSCDPWRIQPEVAADAAGNFVVVWAEYEYPGYTGDGYGWGIMGQRFDSTGGKQGGQFQVNTYTTGDQGNQFDTLSVASDAAGNFVVVWPSYEGYTDVAGQRFDSAGTKVGGEFRINTTIATYSKPHVASDAAGNFVVVWNGGYAGPGDYSNVAAQRFDSAGTKLGGEFQVNTYTTGDQGYRGLWVTADPAGNFIVTWAGKNSGGYGVSVQQFDSTGARLGGEFLLGPGGGRFALSAAPDADGDFVVAWLRSEWPDYGVVAQRFGDPPLTCASAPRDDCRQQTNPRRGAFRFRDPGNPKRKSMAWRSATIQATAFSDFGDPFTETDYVLCVYDESVNDQPVITAAMPADDICNVVPCWTELSPPNKVIRYLDTLGTPDGIKMMQLRAGDEGRARVGLRARGENVTLPSGALTPPVTVQLQAANGLCFTARFAERIRKNEPGKFIGRAGSPSRAFLDASAALLG